jgi:hypothetical protein
LLFIKIAMKLRSGIRNLAEAIILQSIEDLWEEKQRGDCIAFLRGEGFSVCADLAGMKVPDRLRLLHLIDGVTVHDAAYAENLRERETVEYSLGRG